MSKELLEYINDTENPITNLFLGEWYYKQSHFAAASSFFLRCAEFSEDNIDLRYEGILKTHLCYSHLKDRPYTVENLLKQAISFAPDRPEAYFFLAQYYESKGNHLDAYTYTCIGLFAHKECSKFLTPIPFPGIYGLYLEKAVCAWFVGKPQESRSLYQYIIDKYGSEMWPEHKKIVQNNVITIGHKSIDEHTREYKKIFYDKLKFKFDGSDLIEKNYSQAYQDMMVLFLTNGQRNGTYVEIGSSVPFESNNTALLEQNYNWYGFGLEIDENKVNDYRQNRKNPVVHGDATNIDYEELFRKHFGDKTEIDYLQLDTEPAKNTYKALFEIPFEKYRFKIITYEHDYSADVTRSYRERSRYFFKSLGYELLVNDIGNTPESSFEDWWYHPDMVDINRVNMIKSIDFSKNHYINSLMLEQ